MELSSFGIRVKGVKASFKDSWYATWFVHRLLVMQVTNNVTQGQRSYLIAGTQHGFVHRVLVMEVTDNLMWSQSLYLTAGIQHVVKDKLT